MTSYNQSKVSPRKEGKRALQAYSHAKIWCAIMKTLWRVKEVSKSFHSWETKASFTLRCLVQSPGMFLNIQLSFLVVFVKLITHRHQIFFSVSDPSFVHRKDSGWRTRWNLAKKYLRSIVPKFLSKRWFPQSPLITLRYCIGFY